MKKLINKITGTEMWVANERVDEYIAAGHKPAVNVTSKAATSEPIETKEEPKERKAKKK